MIITISGKPGSGKSTVGKMLAEKLGWKFYSIGDLRGKIAMDRGMTIDELNEIGKTEDWTDKMADDYQKEFGKTEDNFVLDSWAGFHFIPDSFKVFLEVDPEVAGERVFKNQRPDEPPVTSPATAAEMLEKRYKETDARFQKYYGFSCMNKTKFDLVIDTTNKTLKRVVELILEAAIKGK